MHERIHNPVDNVENKKTTLKSTFQLTNNQYSYYNNGDLCLEVEEDEKNISTKQS